MDSIGCACNSEKLFVPGKQDANILYLGSLLCRMSWKMSQASWKKQRKKALNLLKMLPVWNLSYKIHRYVFNCRSM